MKNKLSLFAALLILLCMHSVTAQVTIFKEDFSSIGKWEVYTNDKAQFAIYNGKAILWDLDPNYSGARIQRINTELDVNTDFSISATLTFTGGDSNWGYGIVFGANGESPISGYRFDIAASGYYSLSRWVNGVNTNLTKWIKSDMVKKTAYLPQKVEVRKSGDKWLFYINSVHVDTYPAQTLYGKWIGMVKDNKQRIEYDDLVLVDLLQSNQPPVVYTNDCEAFKALKKINIDDGFGSIRGVSYSVESDGFAGYTFRFPSKQGFPGAQKTYILADSDSKTIVPEKPDKHDLEAVFASGLSYEAAQEQFSTIQKRLADCLKEYHFNTYFNKKGKIDQCIIGEKTKDGFIRSGDVLSIVKDPLKSGSYMISLKIYEPTDYDKELHFIKNPPLRSTEFAKSLMQIIGYAENSFEGKKGDKIDGAGFMATRYATTIKLSGALDNYIEQLLGNAFYGVMEKNVSEQAVKSKMAEWHQKLIQVLGSEYHYTQNEESYFYDHAKKAKAPFLSIRKEKTKNGVGYSIIIGVKKDVEFDEDEEE